MYEAHDIFMFLVFLFNCILQPIGRCIKEISEDMNIHEIKLFLKNKLAGYIKILQVVQKLHTAFNLFFIKERKGFIEQPRSSG